MERFLVAVDCSRVSLDCVRYLNRVLKGNSECEFVLFHVLPTASPNLLKIGEVHRIEALHTKAPHLSGYFWKKEDEDAMNRSTLSRKRCTFFRDGVIISFRCGPLGYLCRCCPRKSKPSSIEVMSVFSPDSVSPRSSRKCPAR